MRVRRLASVALLTALFPFMAVAQDAAEIDRLVREGKVEALESQLGARSPDALRNLAHAHANRALLTKDGAQRQEEFAQAAARYEVWIRAIEVDRAIEPARRAVYGAIARCEFASMILGQWAASDLDEYELFNGQRGDTARLARLTQQAAARCDEAWEFVRPLVDRLENEGAAVEDELLALGVYEPLRRLRHDVRYQAGWANYYTGVLHIIPARERGERLRRAERSFQELLNARQSDDALARCALGLAVTLREQERCEEARRYFELAAANTSQARLSAQIRYEHARNEIRLHRYETARTLLKPLASKDPARLAPEDVPARFYVNLARLWDANSYLLEAQRLRSTAPDSATGEPLRRQAEQARENGLLRMNRLAAAGGTWTNLVQAYVGASLSAPLDLDKAGPAELLFSARELLRRDRLDEAIDRLQRAALRSDASATLSGDVLYELGAALARAGRRDDAVRAFVSLAQRQKDHPRAAEALRLACASLARQAEAESTPENYLRLAETCQLFVATFPRHEARDEIHMWGAAALQAAGRLPDAIHAYDQTPPESARFTESRYRGLICRRDALLADNQEPVGVRRNRMAGLVVELRNFGVRAAASENDQRWAALALLATAETQNDPPLSDFKAALATLDEFEKRYPESSFDARALALRIQALRSLRLFDDATAAVDRYLAKADEAQAGGVLAGLTRGMQEEAERLRAEGNTQAAREIATSALPLLEQLDAWVQADPSRKSHQNAVRFIRAQMSFYSGRNEEAIAMLDELLVRNPRDGRVLLLRARALSEGLAPAPTGEPPPRAMLDKSRDAWGQLLRSDGLRNTDPPLYWEARYELLRLTLMAGDSAGVAEAIRHEQAWSSQLGGPEWRARFAGLYERATGRPLEAAGSTPSSDQP